MSSKRYSHLPINSKGDNIHLYNYLNNTITSETRSKRAQLKNILDDFCTFWWRGVDAFETFGAFITNKNDLKFYNGPGFSNEYTQPQFESSAGQLTGVKFKTQQIAFTIGVYWISIEHYRQLIYWLHPYEINTLAFGFDHKHYYQVKLANIADSTRTVIGYEMVDGQKEERYYTELKLTFEIQGTPCAYNWDEFNLIPSLEQEGGTSEDKSVTGVIFQVAANDNDAKVGSDLPAPIQANFALQLSLETENFRSSDNTYIIKSTTWHLIKTIDWPSSTITVTRDFASNSADYTSITIDPNEKTISYDSDVVYTETDGWVPTNEDSDDTGDSYSSLYRALIFANTDDNLTEPDLIDFLIRNSQVEYYNNMKVNCVLTAGMVADPTADIPSAALDEKVLFDVTLKNLTWANSIDDVTNIFDLGYDSESGILYMTSADSQYFLLNTLSTSAKGQRIVDSMIVNTFSITGLFEDPAFNIKNLYFVLRFKTYSDDGVPTSDLTITSNDLMTGATVYCNHFVGLHFENSGTYISLRGRTNLI